VERGKEKRKKGRQEVGTRADPQVGAVQTMPPDAFSSATARAYANRSSVLEAIIVPRRADSEVREDACEHRAGGKGYEDESRGSAERGRGE